MTKKPRPIETDESHARFKAMNIVNQIGDLYSEMIPSEDWVRVRQATNDRLDAFVTDILLDTPDDEEFCARCLAGVESPEHGAKCVRPGYAEWGESAEETNRD